MPARKFGFFGGVFTPSLLTILGVIMYMRLGWVVGEAGLWGALGIILIAHIISVSTGLSIASIATDKKIEAGGIYYILSRSLGLPIGGATGITLFIGTSLSIALYLVGFAENFLGIESISNFLGIELSINGIRIIGSVVILLLVILAFISTSLAIRAQFFILAAIVLSLVSIGIGLFRPTDFSTDIPNLLPLTGHIPFEAIFAVFFPAVTGFTAGVALSGDLKDPRKAIPKGTLLAILVGFIVYVGLAIAIGISIDRDILTTDPNFLMRIAWFSPLVVAGIWGATLSSALGGILGAPRILQALSQDGITPRIFRTTQGINNEPRNALLLTYLIAEAGILIGDLNVIARIVSMFYIAAYGFINLSLALESWASSDFRPSFKIRPIVGVIGFVACFVVMFQIDILAMVMAMVVMISIYLYLAKKEMQLDFGDVWQSVYSSIVRSSLHKMDQRNIEERNWRPNIILFSGGSKARPHLVDFGKWLVGKHGFLSNFDLQEEKGTTTLQPKHQQRIHTDDSLRYKGVFTRKQVCKDVYTGIESIAQSYGFAGVEPNTIMLGWARHSEDPKRFGHLLNHLEKLDLNLLLMDYDRESGFGQKKQIDIWWRGSGQNGNLALSLVRLLQLDPKWQSAKVRLLVVNPVNNDQDLIHRKAQKVVEYMRMTAQVRIINNQIEQKDLYDIIKAESVDSDLIFLGTSSIPDGEEEKFVQDTNQLCKDIGSVILVRASSTFRDLGIGTQQTATKSEQIAVSAKGRTDSINSSLKKEIPVTVLSERLNIFEKAAHGFVNDGLNTMLEGQHHDIIRVTDQIRKSVLEIEDKLVKDNRSELIRRTQKSISFRIRKLVNDLKSKEQSTNLDQLQAIIDKALNTSDDYTLNLPYSTPIQQAVELLSTHEDDGAWTRLRKYARRSRLKKTRKTYTYTLKLRKLIRSRFPAAHYHAMEELMRTYGTHTLSLLIEVREMHRDIIRALASLDRIKRDDDTPQSTTDAESKEIINQIIKRIEEVEDTPKTTEYNLINQANKLVNYELKYVLDILENPFPNQKIGNNNIKATKEIVSGLPQLWFRNQQLLFSGTSLDINLLIYYRRIREVIIKSRDKLGDYIHTDLRKQIEVVHDVLQKIKEQEPTKSHESIHNLERSIDFKIQKEALPQSILKEAEERIRTAAGIFPNQIEILDDESLNRFLAIQFDEIGTYRISVRKLIDNIIQEEVVLPLSEYRGWIGSQISEAWATLERVIHEMLFALEEEKVSSSLSSTSLNLLEHHQENVNEILKDTDKIVEQTFFRIEERLNSLSQELTFYPFITKALNLKQHIRQKEQKRWYKEMRSGITENRQKFYNHIASYWYRHSRTKILADRLESTNRIGLTAQQELRDSLLNIKPRQKVLSQLPFFYKQLFQRRNLYITDYFAGRKDLLGKGNILSESFKSGARTSLLVTGQPGSGKSFLASVIANRNFEAGKILHLIPPENGSTDPSVLHSTIQQQLSNNDSQFGDLNELPDGSVIIIDDLELWWNKSPEGFKVLDYVEELFQLYDKKFFFIFTCNQYALEIMNHTHTLPGKIGALIECGAMDAKEIADAILKRQNASGLDIKDSKQSQGFLLPWNKARIFSRIFNISGGNISSSLAIWLSFIDSYENNSVRIRLSDIPDTALIDQLGASDLEVLYYLILHKRLDSKKLEKICRKETEVIHKQLNWLVNLQLVRETGQGSFMIEPAALGLVIKHLKNRAIINS